ncbi:MAG: hypothetical protein FJ098_13520, partial [Deltaproteobacteria bacterium]|nr:hypothetical protein [Deltaproteobacteria bacterium]
MVRWHQPGLVTSLAALLVSFSGCPRPAEAVLPFYEEVYLREKPEPQEQPRENWDLERILEDDVDDPSVPPPPPDPAVAWRDWLAGVPSESVGKAS